MIDILQFKYNNKNTKKQQLNNCNIHSKCLYENNLVNIITNVIINNFVDIKGIIIAQIIIS
jgi:hypothetical protein